MAVLTDKREIILENLLDLITERGFHDTPMSLLARKSGVSVGIIYHYFPSKEMLIDALYVKVKLILGEALTSGDIQNMTESEAFKRVWLNAFEFYSNHKKEALFLEQYKALPNCREGEAAEFLQKDKNFALLVNIFRTASQGGVLKDLPMDAIYELSIGVAMRLAIKQIGLDDATKNAIVESCWTAVSA